MTTISSQINKNKVSNVHEKMHIYIVKKKKHLKKVKIRI